MTLLALAAAGGVGSALRYLSNQAVPEQLRRRFPWGTQAVNLLGSFLLGLLTGFAPGGWWQPVIGVGLLGGYTTFSTASVECVQLVRQGRLAAAFLHGAGMAFLCVLAALAGIVLGRLW